MQDPEVYRSVYSQLLEEGMTPDQIEAAFRIMESQSEYGFVDPDVEYAESMADTPGAYGRAYGRVYKAAHPLEHLGVLAQRAAGEQGRRKARGRQEELLQQILDERRKAIGVMEAPATQGPRTSTKSPVVRPAQTHPLEPMPEFRGEPYIGPQPFTDPRRAYR